MIRTLSLAYSMISIFLPYFSFINIPTLMLHFGLLLLLNILRSYLFSFVVPLLYLSFRSWKSTYIYFMFIKCRRYFMIFRREFLCSNLQFSFLFLHVEFIPFPRVGRNGVACLTYEPPFFVRAWEWQWQLWATQPPAAPRGVRNLSITKGFLHFSHTALSGLA